MLNKVDLLGRLVRDPDLRTTTGGTSVASFTLAVDRDYKSQDGSREADFIPVVAWKGTAEFVERNFVKGQLAVVTGRLQVRSYTDKDGTKRTSTEVVAENIYFAGPKPGSRVGTPEYTEIENDGELPF